VYGPGKTKQVAWNREVSILLVNSNSPIPIWKQYVVVAAVVSHPHPALPVLIQVRVLLQIRARPRLPETVIPGLPGIGMIPLMEAVTVGTLVMEAIILLCLQGSRLL